MKNAVAYARVSTKEQAEKGLSIPAQLKAIREYAKSQDLKILEEYVDEGESVKTTDRPSFKKWLRGVRKIKPLTLSSFIRLIDSPEITLTFTLTNPF